MDSSVFLSMYGILVGVLLGILGMLVVNQTTFHVQVMRPTEVKQVRRITGISRGDVWHSIRGSYWEGYKVAFIEETRGVGVEYVIMERVVAQ